MKRLIFYALLFIIACPLYSQQTEGTVIVGTIVTSDSLDNYATHDDWFGRVAYRCVSTITQRNLIPQARRIIGMKVYVEDTKRTYRLQDCLGNGCWVDDRIDTLHNGTFSTGKITIQPSGVDPSFLFDVYNNDGYQRFGLSKNGLLLAGRRMPMVVNVDALAYIGDRNELTGTDAFVIGKDSKAEADSSGVIGFSLDSPDSATLKIGYKNNFITFKKDSIRVFGNFNFGGNGASSSPRSGLFHWNPDSNSFWGYPPGTIVDGSFNDMNLIGYNSLMLYNRSLGSMSSVSPAIIAQTMNHDAGLFYSVYGAGIVGATTSGTTNARFGQDGDSVTFPREGGIKIYKDGYNYIEIIKNSGIGIGRYARYVDNGYNNIGIGASALYSGTGSDNIGIGSAAMSFLRDGSYNIALGNRSLYAHKTGNNNIAIGQYSLTADTSGSQNIGIGYASLNMCTSGYDNIAFGRSALNNLTTGHGNIAIGNYAGRSINLNNWLIIHNTSLGTQDTMTSILCGEMTNNVVTQKIRIYGNFITGNYPSNQYLHINNYGSITQKYNGNIVFSTTTDGVITGNKYQVATLNNAPSSASDTGTTGEIRYTADYIYICTSANTWKRVEISTW